MSSADAMTDGQEASPSLPKIALVAGGGQFPIEIAEYLRKTNRPYCVFRFIGLADEALKLHHGYDTQLGNFGELFSLMKQEACTHVCMIGYVKRPDYDTMTRDSGGAKVLPSIASASRGGDDSLLRQVAKVFEDQGFVIEGAHKTNPELLISSGLQAGPKPSELDIDDINEAVRVARGIGALDIGQAVVVAGKITLAVEAQEGTQAMLARVLSLSPVLKGSVEAKKGVLAKLAKPGQDLRLDMPTIGVSTIDDCCKSGLAGIVAQSGALLIADKQAVFDRANELGLFIYGYDINNDA